MIMMMRMMMMKMEKMIYLLLINYDKKIFN